MFSLIRLNFFDRIGSLSEERRKKLHVKNLLIMKTFLKLLRATAMTAKKIFLEVFLFVLLTRMPRISIHLTIKTLKFFYVGTECVTELDYRSEMIVFESLLTTF